ncbi:MAG: AAA family ATPase [Deltaproteobacteria bacterium]|jgi:DNA helicase II / ATP-dependent DNA helicase PcrA|nr:AAA family ATPase [Deltaproteobacteria bacterium]MBT4641025.1 AAA family ATPase [Deltaproteobacteria bacterium]MBT6498908.1 AAA family ATPase [Deltaproteobacteria bacterium]MBT7715275.1 AAA family ATPase [Deltaproteobacteria bacterium]
MNTIQEAELKIIEEEEYNLQRLQSFSPVVEQNKSREDILDQMATISEQIPEASGDDMTSLNEQLMRLNILLAQEEQMNEEGVNLNNPYFAHIRLTESGRTRDLYVGNQVYQTPDLLVQIIDWKVSPIAMIYFLYEEGDEYEEEIDGRLFEGEMKLKRIIKVSNGELVRIQQGELLLVKEDDDRWQKYVEQRYLLKGGAESATRPGIARVVDPRLGIDRQGNIRKDKLLPEITALIDPDQFALITRPESGFVVIQGTAGSGKTTVALHRVAWLYFRDPKRFNPETMMVMVFNKALATYISKVLPSLGVHNVKTEVFEDWASRCRIRLLQRRLPKHYSDRTPVSVIRFKKHPALLTIIREFIAEKNERFNRELADHLERKGIRDFPTWKLQQMPFISRLYTLNEWIEGDKTISGVPFRYGVEVSSRIQRLISDFIDPEKTRLDMVILFWEELFTNFEHLRVRFKELAGGDLSDGELSAVGEWQKSQYIQRFSLGEMDKTDLLEIFIGDEKKLNEMPTLDYEDDPILLYFYQHLFKEIVSNGGGSLELSHLMVDEVQDLSPVELAVLLKTLKEPASITLAGDVNQKMVEQSGFMDWERMFESLGLQGEAVSTLTIGYRSTFEIMTFALELLGDLASVNEVTSTRNGPPIELFHFSNQGELVYFLAKSLKDLTIIEPNASIALICLNPEDATSYFQLLDKMELNDLRLISDQDFPFTPGIDVTDIKQVKGLEFDYVILLDVDGEHYPDNNYSRYLLHIGATRAAHQLWLMNCGDPSPIIPAPLLTRMIQ